MNIERPEKNAEGAGAVDGIALLPLRDMAGYACFVTWAFAVGWDAGVGPFGALPGLSAELLFFFSRSALFGGVALGACVLFFAGDRLLSKMRSRYAGLLACGLCTFCVVTFFVDLPFWQIALMWFCSGAGQAMFFFLWGARFRVLSRKQQLYAACGAFASGGLLLMLIPFIDPLVVSLAMVVLPFASYALLMLAFRRFEGESSANGALVPSDVRRIEGILDLKKFIPFDEDRRYILLKGLFALLYSIPLGFVACAVLCDWLYPANDVVIGLSNASAALVMIIVLREHALDACNVLPQLFLPIMSFSCLLLGVLWPSEGVLVCAVALFTLFGCYEMINAYTSYAYSSYDVVRCLWELYSSKAGNSTGFFLGWTSAVAVLYVFAVDPWWLLSLLFLAVSIAIVADTLFFKKMKLEFREVVVDEGSLIEALDPATAEFAESSKGGGRWNRACEELAETYKLSPRQKEIFLLLAKGRNVQFIKDKLVLSVPTVKSHVYSIYQKMEIHSHQELLDLVEEHIENMQ